MSATIVINPARLSDDDKLILYQYIKTHSPDFIAKKDTLSISSASFRLTHNLIIDKTPPGDNIRYFVSSNEESDLLGEGGFSKVRRAIGYITISPTGKVTYQAKQNRAILIANPKKTQTKHLDKDTSYTHHSAEKAFEKTRSFTHLKTRPPVERAPYKGSKGFAFATKSYSVMKALPGQDLDLEIVSFLRTHPSTQSMLNTVIIPLLEAYKTQIADKGYVHRDIKLPNIRARLISGTTPTFNFLDVNRAEKIGSPDTPFGSPGYCPPEAHNPQTVMPSRDIFSLGVALVSCVNPLLEPNRRILDEYEYDDMEHVIQFSWEEIKHFGCYDPDRLPTAAGEHYHFFQFIDLDEHDNPLPSNPPREAARTEIKNILKKMTDHDPLQRPDINDAILQFKMALIKLQHAASPKSP